MEDLYVNVIFEVLTEDGHGRSPTKLYPPIPARCHVDETMPKRGSSLRVSPFPLPAGPWVRTPPCLHLYVYIYIYGIYICIHI